MRIALASSLLIAGALAAQQPAAGPYKVLMTARVGGEGGTDYIHANALDGRLYITRNAVRAVPATDSTPAREAVPGRVTVFDLKTLKPLGEILNGGGNGAVVDAKSGHGFASSHPDLSMFDTKSMQMIKTHRPKRGQSVGESEVQRRWHLLRSVGRPRLHRKSSDEGSHRSRLPRRQSARQDRPRRRSGADDLGWKGTLYAVLQDSAGSVAVVDQKTMKTTKHYPLGDIGRCNGLALDVKNNILFAACAQGRTPGQPPQPVMVILSATTGRSHEAAARRRVRRRGVQSADDGSIQLAGNGTLTVVKENSPTSFEVVAESPDDERRAHDDARPNDGQHLRHERGARARSAGAGRWRGGAAGP